MVDQVDDKPIVAVLFQKEPTPVQGGLQKPAKPGGYRDSGADIAYALQKNGVRVVTSNPRPNPALDEDWVFGDDIDGIRAALEAHASILWANTTLYQGHPLAPLSKTVPVVGQRIVLVDRFEDKWVMHQWLRAHQFPVPRMWEASSLDSFDGSTPLILKPRRGRGSQGVKRLTHVRQWHLEGQDTGFVLEEFLPGEEVTVTVLPPGSYGNVRSDGYWALPAVTRTNHQEGVIPYSGDVPVLDNSFVDPQMSKDLEHFMKVSQAVARELCSRAWLRIDARQDIAGVYRIIDVNFKPNLTGPGRPGCGRQTSLVAMAAEAGGWSYPTLVTNLLQSQDWTSPI